jgi:hypothetical protein
MSIAAQRNYRNKILIKNSSPFKAIFVLKTKTLDGVPVLVEGKKKRIYLVDCQGAATKFLTTTVIVDPTVNGGVATKV